MGDLGQFGRMLLSGSAILALVGPCLVMLGRVLPGSRLPGGIAITRGSASCLIPLATSLLLSLLLTVLLNLWTQR